MCGIMKNQWLEKFVCIEKGARTLTVEVKLGNERIFILPVYLNCNSWLQDFLNLESWCIENYQRKNIICGDLNGRIGQEQNLGEVCDELDVGLFDYIRSSRDNVINANGRKLLEFFEDNDLIVLNGRSKSDPS